MLFQTLIVCFPLPTGWFGLALIFLLCINAGYAGVVLARCWLILEERYSKYRSACREPYPAIGLMAFGPKMRALVTTCVQITLIGSMVVILLLAAQIITNVGRFKAKQLFFVNSRC